MQSALAIAFDYRPSRWLRIALIVMTLCAVAAIAASGLPTWAKVGAVGLVASYSAQAWRTLALPKLTRCAWHANGQWRVRAATGDEHSAQLVRASVRGPMIVLLLLAGPLRRVSLVLLPDNTDPDLQRRLRVRLSRADAATTQQDVSS